MHKLILSDLNIANFILKMQGRENFFLKLWDEFLVLVLNVSKLLS